MRYAALKHNDTVDCDEGVCVSFWLQGCPLHCEGCHNPQTWNPLGGEELPQDILEQIDEALEANGVKRNFSVLGGEPFASYNLEETFLVVHHVKEKYPDRKIFCWSGYNLEELQKVPLARLILKDIDVLIDGPFILSQRDITLELRGSTNQKIRYRGKDF